MSPNGSVRLVRLDPLSDSDIEAMVESHDPTAEAARFLEAARRRRLGGMLQNPQSLDLLLRAFVRSGGSLPESPRATFEQACLDLAAEQNDEHLDSRRDWPSDGEIVDAASEVCALLLLSGAAGVRRHEKDRTPDWVFLGSVPDHPQPLVEAAVGTAVFTAASEPHRFEPVHRVVAEFLAARHLAARVAAGIPVACVLRLITVDCDGGAIPTPLRGLAAWLAAACPPARGRLIRCDPVGVAAYGDATGFSTGDNERLLDALGQREPEFGSWRFSDTLVEALSGPDMEPALVNILASTERGPAMQVVAGLALRSMAIGECRPHLLDRLMSIVRDPTRFPIVHRQALDAFLHNGEGESAAEPMLRALLDDLRDGRVADDDRELTGTLLHRMYPTGIPPGDIWNHLVNQPRMLVGGRYDRFWMMEFTKRIPTAALPTVVDGLVERLSVFWGASSDRAGDDGRPAGVPGHPPEFWDDFAHRGYEDLPLRVVARAVTECGEEVSVSRLYEWLRVGTRWRKIVTSDGHEAMRGLHEWFGARPPLLRSLWREGIRQYTEPEDRGEPGRDVLLVLVPVGLPPEFGRFCLEQAVEIMPDKSMLAYGLLREAVQRSAEDGIPVAEIEERAGVDETLAGWLPDLLAGRLPGEVS